MSRPIRNNIDYANEVAWWTTKFNQIMLRYANAPVVILAYYLKGTSELVACPCEIQELKEYAEIMRTSCVLFAAAEDSGLFAEAVPELFGLALDNHSNWCAMSRDVAYLLQHPHMRRFIPFEHLFLAEAATAAHIALVEDGECWTAFIKEARKKLAARVNCCG